jgi:hypothetical protein
MTIFEYPVLAFRQQQDSPVLVTFVAPTGELVKWSGVPRKSDELLTGFQRFLDRKRVDQQVVPFFQDERNSSPTAIIVALRPDSGLGRCKLETLPSKAMEIISTKLVIEIDDEKMKTDAIFEAALEYVESRLKLDGSPTKNEDQETLNSDEDDADEEDDGDEDESDDTDSESDDMSLGSETLVEMKKLLEDKSNWANKNFRDSIEHYVRPAFLIDGQHRANAGSMLGEKGLPFMVCGLYDASWEEQVFQFTIVNVKPVKIRPSLIASIAALSLSKTEQDLLKTRLSNAGIKLDEVRLMSLVAYNDNSPFLDLIDMGVQRKDGTTEMLGYGGMKRLSKVWTRANRNSLTQISKVVSGQKALAKSRKAWAKNETWFRFFCEFWSTVKSHYGDELWKKNGNKLFVGATLYALQDALLSEVDGVLPSQWTNFAGSGQDSERIEKCVDFFKEILSTHLSYIPKKVFTTPWEKDSLDTDQGRQETAELFRRFIDEGKKHGKPKKGWEKWSWFKQISKAD